MAISANVGGWIADTLVERGASVTTVRKVMQVMRERDIHVPSIFRIHILHQGHQYVGAYVMCYILAMS